MAADAMENSKWKWIN